MTKSAKVQKIRTVGDARDEKRLQDAIMEARYANSRANVVARAWAASDAALKSADPRIGVLCRNGLPVFYTMVGGDYREGSVESLTASLPTS